MRPPSPEHREVEIRGAPAALWDLLRYGIKGKDRAVLEVLVDGPRGTGKSRGIGTVLYWLCTENPGVRVLVARKTRASLTESFVPQFEDDVCQRDKVIINGPSRINRHSYDFPNGSTLVLGSLEEPDRLLSTDWDVIVFQQGEELTDKDSYQKLLPCLRHWAAQLKVQMIVLDCNPGAPSHWIMHRVKEGKMLRFRSKHQDNPKWYNARTKLWTEEGETYINTLKGLEGVDYYRGYLGEWRAAEGQVWSNWNPDIHLIDTPINKDGYLDVDSLGIVSWVGAMDWGYTAPGVLQIWGVGERPERNMVLCREIYRQGESLDWWCEKVLEENKNFPMQAIVADPSRPDSIRMLNDRLTEAGHHRLVRPADNKRVSTAGSKDLAGLDLVRWGFSQNKDGFPRIRMLKDCQVHIDDTLVKAGRPWRTQDEVGAYVYDQGKQEDTTDSNCEDHGCDSMRYMAMWLWKRMPQLKAMVKEQFAPWTIGSMDGTPASLWAAKVAKMQDKQRRSPDFGRWN